MVRKYQIIWNKIILNPNQPQSIFVKWSLEKDKEPLETKMARIRKAVWKEKEKCKLETENGTKLKELYRLDCILDVEKHIMTFKLEKTIHPENL